MRAMPGRTPRLATALLAVGLACGGGDEPLPSGPPLMAQPAQEAQDTQEAKGNQPPVIEGIRFEPRYPTQGDRLRARVRTRDPDGDAVEIGYLWTVDGETVRSQGNEIDLSQVRKGSRVEVRAIASDGRSESSPVSESAVVLNRSPVIRGVTIEPQRAVTPGEAVTATADAEDPDGDALRFRYRWTVNDRPVSSSLNFLPTSDLSDGDVIQVEVSASDGDSESQRLRSAAVRVSRANSPPEITSKPSPDQPGDQFRYTVEARDPDGDRALRYSLRQAPAGMTIDPVLGEITWRPESSQAGEHPVEVVVEDSEGAFSVQRFQLRIGEKADAPPANAEE